MAKVPQRSPGLMAGERGRHHAAPHVRRRAATEPRPDGRGETRSSERKPSQPDSAATEPRPDGRGESPIGVLACMLAMMPQRSPGLMAGESGG